jgi:DNA-binding transcriptional LysR family regulator
MKLTPDGEKFIGFAKSIIGQMNEIENFYKNGNPEKQKFSISVPRASYISEAFAEFTKTLAEDPAEIFYKETNSQRTIHNMVNHDYKLGIIRYAENYDMYFKAMLEEKGFDYELVTEFSYILVMSADSPLAQKEIIEFDDLKGYIEIAHADPYVPSMPLSKVVKEELPDNIDRRIYVFERGSQFELLNRNHNTFMWVSPAPQDLLTRYNLVQKDCPDNKKVYRDLLIYKKGYKLNKLEKKFITALYEAKDKYI